MFPSISEAAVPEAYRAIAREYGIPDVLLYSVALTESEKSDVKLPWPWVANVEGRGIYFNTRQEMYSHLSALVREGRLNFDVGIMQVNWRWNKHVFSSLMDATDPYINMRGGASILRELYLKHGSFEIAVGKYHSPNNQNRASAYRERVRKRLALVLKGER